MVQKTHEKPPGVLFRIFYSTSFTICFLFLITLICVSPADVLYQSYKRRRLIDIFMTSGAYVFTALIAALIYASRLYTTRSILKDIPKTYIPLDREELPGKRTWSLIRETIKRSAVVNYLGRPRARRVELGFQQEEEGESSGSRGIGEVSRRDGEREEGEEDAVDLEKETEKYRERIRVLLNPEIRKNDDTDELDAVMGMAKRWGVISHAGWSSPADTQMPNLEYSTVVAELTALVEAKAVSLAPIDPSSTMRAATTFNDNDEDDNASPHPVPDVRVVEALTRPPTAGMREYLSQLIKLDVVSADPATAAFLTLYERARFAVEPLSSDEFRTLMHMFADLLGRMKKVDIGMLDLDDDLEFEHDHDDNPHLHHESAGVGDKNEKDHEDEWRSSRGSQLRHEIATTTITLAARSAEEGKDGQGYLNGPLEDEKSSLLKDEDEDGEEGDQDTRSSSQTSVIVGGGGGGDVARSQPPSSSSSSISGSVRRMRLPSFRPVNGDEHHHPHDEGDDDTRPTSSMNNM